MSAETFGSYRIEELLGRGGMGEVHRAYDTVHERVVALKRLSEPFVAADDYRARFRRESQIVARLREPHVIPIHAFGEIDGRLYLDMRLVEGVDLTDLMHAPMPPKRAVALLGQVAGALDAAHADGLIHRDVKPSNVLVTPADFVYLVDFGIARSIGGTSITQSGSVIGTLDYMAPERFGNGPTDGRVDVYALACVMFECVTGHRPFTATEPVAQVHAHLHHPPPRASARNPALPREFDDVLARGMAKDPARRYATAGEFVAAAKAALQAPRQTAATAPATPPRPVYTAPPPRGVVPTRGYVMGPPPGSAPPPRPAPSRRGVWMAAISAVLVIAAVVTVLLIVRAGADSPAAAGSTDSPSQTQPTSEETTTQTPTGPSQADQHLLQNLPEVYRNTGCKTGPQYQLEGSQAAAFCTTTTANNDTFDPPDQATFYSFADRAAEDAFFQKVVSTHQLTRDDSLGGCNPLKRWNIYGLYYRDTSGPIGGEYLTCFIASGTGQLLWVDTRRLVVGQLSSSGAATPDGLDDLYYWWNEEILASMK